MVETVHIRSIRSVPLMGDSPKGGWSAEIRPEDSVHALIAVHTDIGVVGYGSVFTDGRMVAALSGWDAAAHSPTSSVASISRFNCQCLAYVRSRKDCSLHA